MDNNHNVLMNRDFESEIFGQTPWALKQIQVTRSALKPIGIKNKEINNHKNLEVKTVETKEKQTKTKKESPKIDILNREKKDNLQSVNHTFTDLKHKSFHHYLKNVEEKFSLDMSLYEEKFHNEEGIDVLFVGEKIKPGEYPVLLSATCSDEDLMGRMILAMKVPSGKFVRRFIPSDINWDGVLDDRNTILEDIALEILFLRPKVVVCMGAGSTNMLLSKKERLSKVHGQNFSSQVKFTDKQFNFRLLPIFHPDFLEINPSMKRTAWMDLQEVMKLL